MTSIRSHRLSYIPIKIMGPFIVSWSRLLPTILFSIVFFPSPTLASIRRDLDSGMHYFCYDGSSSVYASMKGVGLGLNGNGSMLPFNEGIWTPILDSPGCYYRPMSDSTRYALLRNFIKYCALLRKNYCFLID